MQCLGIDIGSSSIKAAVLNLDSGSLEHTSTVAFPSGIPNLAPGHFEVQPSEILACVHQLLGELLDRVPEVQAIFVSSQMGGVLVLDSEYRLITNCVSWRDQRSLQAFRGGKSYLAVAREWIGEEYLAELGNELKPGSTTALLFWLQQHGYLTPGMIPVTLGAFVVSKLSGHSPAVEHSEAIGTWDLQSGKWHSRAFEQLGIGRLNWPEIADLNLPSGDYSHKNRNYPVFPAVGDHPCSLMGVDLADSELSINVSTGSQVSLLTRQLCLGDWQTRFAVGGGYLNTITHLPAGRSLKVLVDLVRYVGNVSESEAWKQIREAVEHAQDSELEVDLAFFDGPMGREGSIRGITLENLTLGGLFRAAFENMADNYASCASLLSPSQSFKRIVLSGGLTQRMPLLREKIYARFHCPVRECPEGDDALLGLLRVAKMVVPVSKQV